MNPLTTSSHLTRHAHRAFTHPLSVLRLILLFVMLALLSSLSVPAAEPPNSVHPPSRTVPASPALRTSRAQNTLRPQADTGWYYADDSRYWYYQLPDESTSPLSTAAQSASLQPTTARHSDSTAASIVDAPFSSLPVTSSITDSLSSSPPSTSLPSAQELREYTLTKTEENAYLPLDDDGEPLLSMYLKPERYIPSLADSWRSDESYWLRSTPSAYLSEDTYAEQVMSDEATRDEYFLQADSTGNIYAAHYDDTAAVRLIFTIK